MDRGELSLLNSKNIKNSPISKRLVALKSQWEKSAMTTVCLVSSNGPPGIVIFAELGPGILENK